MSHPPRPDAADADADLLAAEWALGLLEGDDLARAEALAQSAPEFAAAVAAWQNRLASLADEAAETPPPPQLLAQIEAGLFSAQPSQRLPLPPAQAAPLPRLWARLRRWLSGDLAGLLGTGALAAASALVMALLLQWGGAGGDMPMVQTTLLSQPGSPVHYLARLEGGQLLLRRTEGPAPATGRAYELWIIPQGGAAQSLGLIADDLSLPAPQLATFALAITEEPTGGAPGGVASGPVLAQGHFAAD